MKKPRVDAGASDAAKWRRLVAQPFAHVCPKFLSLEASEMGKVGRCFALRDRKSSLIDSMAGNARETRSPREPDSDLRHRCAFMQPSTLVSSRRTTKSCSVEASPWQLRIPAFTKFKSSLAWP